MMWGNLNRAPDKKRFRLQSPRTEVGKWCRTFYWLQPALSITATYRIEHEVIILPIRKKSAKSTKNLDGERRDLKPSRSQEEFAIGEQGE
jgi:hypothetical protein